MWDLNSQPQEDQELQALPTSQPGTPYCLSYYKIFTAENTAKPKGKNLHDPTIPRNLLFPFHLFSMHAYIYF